jgi:multidrug efflux system membrane fusion protein
LVRDGIVTAEQYDLHRTQAESLEADLAAQKATQDSLRVQLAYSTIRSPITGRTGNLMINAGNVVKANDTLSLVTINQITPIAVSFSIPEPELHKVRNVLVKGGLLAEATPSGDSGRPEQGRVTFIDNAVDSSTGTIRLKATFANSARKLWPGQSATVKMILPPVRDAVTVDIRPVRTGARADGSVVIADGLKTGEQVVIDGHMRLGPGVKIELKKPEPPKIPGLPNNSTARVRAGA